METPRRILTQSEHDKLMDGELTSSARRHIREAILEFTTFWEQLDEDERKNIFNPARKSAKGQSVTSVDEMLDGAGAVVRFIHRAISETHDPDVANSIIERETEISESYESAEMAAILNRAKWLVDELDSSVITRDQVTAPADQTALDISSFYKDVPGLGVRGQEPYTQWSQDPLLWNSSMSLLANIDVVETSSDIPNFDPQD